MAGSQSNLVGQKLSVEVVLFVVKGLLWEVTLMGAEELQGQILGHEGKLAACQGGW